MEEKVLLKSKQSHVLHICIIVFTLFMISALGVTFTSEEYKSYAEAKQIYLEYNTKIATAQDDWWKTEYEETQRKYKTQYLPERAKNCFGVFLPVFGVGVAATIFIYAWLSKNEMTVTNKRVYGKAIFGKRVDLPLDSISAVGSCWPKGIAVASSSGKVSFLMFENRDELHKCISDLLIERQQKEPVAPVIKQEVPQSQAEELKKYKELLDMGVLSQEEFEAKKKQLLGL